MRLDSIDYLCCPACKGNFRLTIKIQLEAALIEGSLECLACSRRFDIRDGFPNLTYPETLEDSDLLNERWHDQNAQRYDRANRRWMRNLGLWKGWLWETGSRRQLVNRLEIQNEQSVLETGVGTGSNLPLMSGAIGKRGQLHGIDISINILRVARQKMKAEAIQAELVQGNASYLPYRDEKFDAVLHVGALNQFGDKKRAIEEMHRVARLGAKVVICDEGLAPGKNKTWHGKWILRRDPVLFVHEPPIELIPKSVEDCKVYWIWQRCFWVIEYRKV